MTFARNRPLFDLRPDDWIGGVHRVSCGNEDGSGLDDMPKEGNMYLLSECQRAKEFEDVEEAARIRLQMSPYRAIRRCSCSYDGEVLRLHGEVPTYHYKQLAQVAIAGMVGVQSVVNDIRVDTGP